MGTENRWGLVPRSGIDVDVLPAEGQAGDQARVPTAFALRRVALSQGHALAQQGNAALGSVFVGMNEVYEDAVGRVIEQKKQIHNGQQRQLSEAFFDASARELGQGLLENYRHAEGQVKRVTSAPFPLDPEPHPVPSVQVPAGRVLEYRRLTLGERLRGEVLVERDD